MAIAAGAPIQVSTLATMLDACAAWSGTNYYPRVEFDDMTFPAAVIDLIDSSTDNIAQLGYVHSGTLTIFFAFADTTVVAIEAFADTISNQLHGVTQSLPIRSISKGLSDEPSNANKAGLKEIYSIQITVNYGLGG